MFRRIIGIIAVLLCSRCFVYAGGDLPFPVGETLEYKLYWGVIPVGRADFQTFWDTVEGKSVIVIRLTAKTTAVVAAIYPVEDLIESTVDPDTLLPVKYIQRLREGRRKRDDEVYFDHKKGEAIWRRIGRDQTKIIKINEDTSDVLALTYRMRGAEFDVGEKARFKVLVDDKLYDLSLDGRQREKVVVDRYGEIGCLEVEPKAKFGEIFVRKGKVRLWFSDDKRRVCVRMTGKVPLANVKAHLVKVDGPGDDFWVNGRDDE